KEFSVLGEGQRYPVNFLKLKGKVHNTLQQQVQVEGAAEGLGDLEQQRELERHPAGLYRERALRFQLVARANDAGIHRGRGVDAPLMPYGLAPEYPAWNRGASGQLGRMLASLHGEGTAPEGQPVAIPRKGALDASTVQEGAIAGSNVGDFHQVRARNQL